MKRFFTYIGIYGVPLLMVLTLVGIFSQCTHASPLRELTKAAEVKYALPTGLLESICYVESHYKVATRDGAAGEIGNCQIKPSTVRMFCPSCAAQTQNIYQGAKGLDVRRVQTALKMGTIDGIFGLSTHIAVTKFQEANGLVPDGIVGPKTWKKLIGTTMPYEALNAQLRDPVKNIDYAARYLVWLREYLKTDRWDILAAAYNGGPANPTVIYMLKVRAAYGQ